MTVKQLKEFLNVFDDNLTVRIDTQGAFYNIKAVGTFLDESTNQNSPYLSCTTIDQTLYGI